VSLTRGASLIALGQTDFAVGADSDVDAASPRSGSSGAHVDAALAALRADAEAAVSAQSSVADEVEAAAARLAASNAAAVTQLTARLEAIYASRRA
jgi:hypothetical protein